MLKINHCFLALLTLVTIPILPEGAGLFLYRYNSHQEVEFLFILDPYQRSSQRKGFEYPGGRVDSSDHADVKDPYTFLNAAIREMLEELVFVPADLLEAAGIFKTKQKPYTSRKKINPQYEREAINCIAQHIMNSNGLFYLHKNQINPKKCAGGKNQMIIFFWDITKICPENLPELIVKKRKSLEKKGFNVTHCLHAEPNEFAWISGSEICKALQGKTITASQHSADHGAQKQNITISPACIGMMKDRSNEKHNQQNETVLIKLPNKSFIGYLPHENQLMSLGKSNTEFQESSSMTAIIKLLQTQRNFFTMHRSQA